MQDRGVAYTNVKVTHPSRPTRAMLCQQWPPARLVRRGGHARKNKLTLSSDTAFEKNVDIFHEWLENLVRMGTKVIKVREKHANKRWYDGELKAFKKRLKNAPSHKKSKLRKSEHTENITPVILY